MSEYAAISRLESVLCDPDGNVVIHGSDADRAIAQQALRDIFAKVKELEVNESEQLRLKMELNRILHSGGNAPENPSMCDLVSYARSDIGKLQAKVKELEAVLEYIADPNRKHPDGDKIDCREWSRVYEDMALEVLKKARAK